MKPAIPCASSMLGILLLSGCNFDSTGSREIASTVSKLQEQVSSLEESQKATNTQMEEMRRSLQAASASSGKWVLWRSPRARNGFMPFIAFYAEDAFPEKAACLSQARDRLDHLGARITGTEPMTGELPDTIVVYACLPNGVPPNVKS